MDSLWKQVLDLGRPVDVACINAGVGVGGQFWETDLDEELNMVELNCASTVHLAKHVVQHMLEWNAGKILFTASIAGEMVAPREAVYAASKSFVLSFAHSVRYELRDTGNSVTALQPGPTDTDFIRYNDRPAVLRQAIQAIRKGGTLSIPGVYGGLLDKVSFGATFGKGITMKMGQTNMHKYMKALLKRNESKQIDPSYIISHRIMLDQAPEMYEVWRDEKDKVTKIVIDPWVKICSCHSECRRVRTAQRATAFDVRIQSSFFLSPFSSPFSL